MPNPIINSTESKWTSETTGNASVKASWSNGTTGQVQITTIGGSVVKDWTNLTNNTALTITGLTRTASYNIHYKVTSGNLTAEKYERLVGSRPPLSIHPNGGVGVGVEATEGMFSVFYPGDFYNDVKFQATPYAFDGYYGPAVSDSLLDRRTGLVPCPLVTASDLSLSESSTDSGLKTFMQAWLKKMVTYFTAINPHSIWIGLIQPGDANHRGIVICNFRSGSSDLVNDLPKYSVGTVIPLGSTFNFNYRFGTENGTFFCKSDT